MATQTKNNTKQEYEEWVDEDTELAEEFTDKLNKLFYRMLKNPSNKEMDNFQTIRDALIVAFLVDLMEKLEQQLNNSMQIGINVANQQLKRLNIDKIVKKTINDKKFKDMFDSVIKSNEVTLAYVLDGIKVNTDNIIKDIKSNVIDTKKVISAELASEFAKNGISEFQDRAGRRIAINNYIKQKSLDEITKIMRNSYFMQAVKYGVPYVRIVHLNLHPTCPLCSPFENRVLALTENDDGVMTLEDAERFGLLHNYCDHVPMAMLLEDKFDNQDIKIVLNNTNYQRYKYGIKKYNYPPLKDILIENPEINNKIVEGLYDKNGLKILENIDNYFIQRGYNLSGHSIERIFERSTPEKAFKLFSIGDKYIDRYGNLTYYKNGLSIHLDKKSKNIITVVYRKPSRKLPKTWRKFDE